MRIEQQIAESQAICAAATPGPWAVEYDSCGDYELGIDDTPFPMHLIGPKSQTKWDDAEWQREYGHRVSELSDMSGADAELIAHARTELPARNAQLLAVKQAVLELHTATSIYPGEHVTDAMAAQERGDTPIARLCLECSDEHIAEMVDEFEWNSSESGSVDYPCATVRAIEDAP
ncbi:hypothetical protein [Nesterenkonia populi]|uniref:hypothetical protein n=1 Tax=Nesterenkonia populi TaxID=1591087 RepID=UPI0011BF4B61|nr:hypothetical protein [Nesterenkonia populi]